MSDERDSPIEPTVPLPEGKVAESAGPPEEAEPLPDVPANPSGEPPSGGNGEPPSDGEVFPPPRLREYRYERFIDRGGMGEVYLYRDTDLERSVAIKFAASRPALIAEARLAARIKHPNVVTIYHVGEYGERRYIVQEYIDGCNLRDMNRPVTWRHALDLALDLARGLAAAHRCGVVHRDLKPGNAVVDAESGRAKLIDFGLARDLDSPAPDSNQGTRGYIAPEVLSRQQPTERSDVFSFGVILHVLCTGMRPRSEDPDEIAATLRREARGIDPALVAIVTRCLAQNPDDRFASGRQIADALAEIGRDKSAEAIPRPKNPYRGLSPFEARHRGLFFGRQHDIEQIIERLRHSRFVLLAGESGVGKSSLARAGVLPSVCDGAMGGSRTWKDYTVVPGRNPLKTLIHQALAEQLGRDGDVILDEVRSRTFAAIDDGLHRLHGDESATVIFIDQLEELVTQSDPDEARLAAELLAHLIANTPGLRVLATARDDKLVALTKLPELGPLIEDALCFVPRLDRDAMREIIVRPAESMGVGFEDDLVESLLESSAGQEGGLPLLQFALFELWKKRDSERKLITREAFESIGGVEGALSRHADDVMDRMLDRGVNATARDVLLELAADERTRRRRTAAELIGDRRDRRKAVDALVKGRLVVSRTTGGETTYEVAHEALLSRWPRLVGWLEEEEGTRIIRERLRNRAADWDRRGRSDEELYRRIACEEAERVAGDVELSDLERAFLTASRRRLRRAAWRRRAIGLLAVVAVALTYGIVEYRDRQAEERAKKATAREVGRHLETADQFLLIARREADGFRKPRDSALTLLEKPTRSLPGGLYNRERIDDLWRVAVEHIRPADSAYDDARRELQIAIDKDRDRGDVRDRLATIIDEQAGFAHLTHRYDARDRLLKWLELYDEDRIHLRGWDEKQTLMVEVSPPGTEARVEHLVVGSAPALIRKWRTNPAALPVDVPPGLQILRVARDDERAEVRYPIFLDRDFGTVSKALDEGYKIDIERPRQSKIPSEFIYIPAGQFLFGLAGNADNESARLWYRTVFLHVRQTGEFLIARHETTYEEWIEFLNACRVDKIADCAIPDAKGFSPTTSVRLRRVGDPRSEEWELSIGPHRARTGEQLVYPTRTERREQNWSRFPVTGITAKDVAVYLDWLRTSGRVPGARLCREDEWERAARGADARLYPHGDTLNPSDANFDMTYGQEPHSFGPDEVGSHPSSASLFGLFNMAGNAREFTEPLLTKPRSDAAPEKHPGASNESNVVVRGGSFYNNASTATVVNREEVPRVHKSAHIGFRVCADYPR